MSYYYDPKKGKSYDLNNIAGVIERDSAGNVVDAKVVGTGTRNMLNLVNTALANDYSYMPTTTKEITQSVALDMMTDSGAFVLAKAVAPVVGGFFGGGFGAGLGYLLVEAAGETWDWAESIYKASDPNKFWDEFQTNMAEAAKTDFSFSRMVSEFDMGLSRTGIGAKQSLYKEWGDLLGEEQYVPANVIGQVVRSGASIAMGATAVNSNLPNVISMPFVVDTAMATAFREGAAELGESGDLSEAAKVAMLSGMADGVMSFTTMKLGNVAAKAFMPEISNYAGLNGFGSAVINGSEMAAYVAGYNTLTNIALDRDAPVDPYTIGASFLLGSSLGYVAHKFRKPVKEIENEIIETKPVQMPVAETLSLPAPKETLSLPAPRIAGLLTYKTKDYNRTLFENFGTDMTADKSAFLAKRLAFSDQSIQKRGDGTETLANRIAREYEETTGKILKNDSAESIAYHYSLVNPDLASTYQYNSVNKIKTVERMRNVVEQEKATGQFSPNALDVIMDESQYLMSTGLFTNEIDAQLFVKSALDIAKSRAGKKSIGNYEVRTAINELLDNFK